MTISDYVVQNLPLDVYQNFQGVELLTPGVISTTGITRSYPNGMGIDLSYSINTNGLSAHMNTTRVDGATDIHDWLPDHMLITPPASTVQEVNVQTADYDVAKGLTAGAATDVATKSGTNQIHGSLYGFHTDQVLDAQNALITLPRKPKLIQNQDGFTLGGPIKKDKVFYFANWEGTFMRQSATDVNLIPPMDMRSGNFTAYLGQNLYDSSGNPMMVCTTEGATVQLQQNMVFDPTTGNTATGQGRCVFSSGGNVNVIPGNRQYAGALNYWKLLPAPNHQIGLYTVNTPYNDIRSRSFAYNRNLYNGRVDYNMNAHQFLWVKYSLAKGLFHSDNDWGAAGTGGGTGILNPTDQMVTLAHSWMPSTNMVFAGHIGFTRETELGKPPDLGQQYGQTVLQLANSNTPLDDSRYSGMPTINMGEFSALGDSIGSLPVTFADWTATIDENATWIHGNHQISFGFDAAHYHMNMWQLGSTCCLRGAIATSDGNTFLNLAPTGNPAGAQAPVYSGGSKVGFNSAAWNGVALFDLGLTSTVYNDLDVIKAASKQWEDSLYVGDMWRATPKLTVTAGVRWEYFTLPMKDGAAKFEGYDPSTDTVQLGGLGGNPTFLGRSVSHRQFAPRLGLAYRLNNNTVVRSGFGIGYDSMPLARPLRQFWPFDSPATSSLTGNSNVTRFLPYGTFSTSNTANSIPGLAVGVPLLSPPTGFYSGSVTPPANVTVGDLAPGEFKQGYVESWNFTVERKLPSQVLLSVAYVGNHFVHELNGQDRNAAPLGTGTAGQPLDAAFGFYGRFVEFAGYLDSHFNSLEVTLNRHVTSGLYLQAAYTYSKDIGYVDDIDGSFWDSLNFQCPASPLMPEGCQSLNRHTLAMDHTQWLTMGFVYNLPFGVHQRWANSNRAARYLAGGWQTNGIFTTYSGDPLSPSQTANYLNTPRTNQVPDFVGPLQMAKQHGSGQFWFNPSAFQPVETVRIGTAGEGLSWLRGPGVANLDFSLFRHFKFKERYDLQIRLQSLNLTNTPHWSDPNMTCSIVTQSSGQIGCGGSFGQITSSFGQRIIQIGAQVNF